jgi:hypothetical protein
LVVNDELPRDLRRALEKLAKQKDATLNDVAVDLLYQHFGMNGWSYSGSSYRRTATRFRLRVPDKLNQRMRRELARIPGSTMRGLAFSILADKLDTKPVDPGRRPRTRRSK